MVMDDDLRQRCPLFFFSAAAVEPLLNHVAQLTAAQTPSQLALLLSSALADADALRRELTVAQSRATSTKRLLASVQGFHSSAPPGPNFLCAQFTEVERYEHACSLRSTDARTAFARLSTASHAPVANPSYPTAACTASPHFQHEQMDDTLSLPSLPLPHAIIVAPQLAHRTRRISRVICVIHYSPALCWHLTPQARPLRSIRLPDTDTLSTERVLPLASAPAAAIHYGVLDGLLNGECEKDFDRKRRRVGGWDMVVDSPSLSQPQHAHAASPPYAHFHASHPLSSHPTALPAVPLPHTSSRTYGPYPTAWSAHAAPTVGAGSVVVPAPPGTNGINVTRIEYDDAGRKHIRVDARELVRDAKGREAPTSVRSHEPTAHRALHGCPWCKMARVAKGVSG
ncbi:hypothetical protein DFH11DRAFT_1730274 [Phellopilus nigrolimitatus]|nr:hypothetical protein DFH11DRAFT_1730274 [Phellopilus nigrolimitatus]